MAYVTADFMAELKKIQDELGKSVEAQSSQGDESNSTDTTTDSMFK